MLDQKEKGPQAVQSQADQRQIISRVIISQNPRSMGGFIGTVSDFRRCVRADKLLLALKELAS